jgi:hypothetical protein
MGIDLHLNTCVDTQSPKYLEMAQGHISLSDGPSLVLASSFEVEILLSVPPSEAGLDSAEGGDDAEGAAAPSVDV